MRPSCYVGAVLNLRPARRIVGRMGGDEEKKKKRRVWENNSLADPGAGNVTPRFAVEAACHNEEIVQSRGIGHFECADFWCECPPRRSSAAKRGVFVCSLRCTRASRGATRLRMGVACKWCR